jgi:hypothetical protein
MTKGGASADSKAASLTCRATAGSPCVLLGALSANGGSLTPSREEMMACSVSGACQRFSSGEHSSGGGHRHAASSDDAASLCSVTARETEGRCYNQSNILALAFQKEQENAKQSQVMYASSLE